MIQIGKDIRIEASEYKGKFYIGIRRWYEKDGEWLPGNKGINLTEAEWNELLEHFEEIKMDIKSVIES